jgi:hypothetical protein
VLSKVCDSYLRSIVFNQQKFYFVVYRAIKALLHKNAKFTHKGSFFLAMWRIKKRYATRHTAFAKPKILAFGFSPNLFRRPRQFPLCVRLWR